VGAPQRWKGALFTDAEVADYAERARCLNIGPNVVHAPYLVNLASTDPVLRRRSIEILVTQMRWCERLGAMGLVVHVGSGKGAASHDECLAWVVEGLEEILARSSSARFLIENTAGMGTSIGSDFADIGEIVRRLGRDERLGMCLDTAHTFEAGHDISTREGLDRVLGDVDRFVGLDCLAAVHANDSKTPFGSNVDRHENIGRGYLGEEAFGHFLTHPATQRLPLYLEVPGFSGRGPDRENIDILRRLAGLPPSLVSRERGEASSPALAR
jgi:deoxyribonuclease-4